MTTNLLITYQSEDKQIQKLNLECDKQKLINYTNYFKSLFENNFKDSNLEKITCDLTGFPYLLSESSIQFYFDYISDKIIEKKYQSTCREISSTDINYEAIKYFLKSILFQNISFDKCCQIFFLNDFFVSNKIKNLLERSFVELYEDLLILKDVFFNKDYIEILKKLKIVTISIISEKSIADYTTVEWPTIVNYIYYNIFFKYLIYHYFICVSIEKEDRFCELINFRKKLNYKKPLLLKDTEYIKNSIEILGFDGYIEYIKCIFKIKKLVKKPINIYDWYDFLNYETCDYEIDQEIHQFDELILNSNKTILIGSPMIVKKNDFERIFNNLTKNIFDDFDWSNVVISGGFIYGILDNITNSIIESTDIDLFIFGEEIDIKQKMEYIFTFFENNNCICIQKNNIITFYLNDIKYPIQIIPINCRSAIDIINNFDLTYCMVFYDGKDIYTNINGLISIKYKIAMRIDKISTLTRKEFRIYKSIKKNIKFIKNKRIEPTIIYSNNYDKCYITNFSCELCFKVTVKDIETSNIIHLPYSHSKIENLCYLRNNQNIPEKNELTKDMFNLFEEMISKESQLRKKISTLNNKKINTHNNKKITEALKSFPDGHLLTYINKVSSMNIMNINFDKYRENVPNIMIMDKKILKNYHFSILPRVTPYFIGEYQGKKIDKSYTYSMVHLLDDNLQLYAQTIEIDLLNDIEINENIFENHVRNAIRRREFKFRIDQFKIKVKNHHLLRAIWLKFKKFILSHEFSYISDPLNKFCDGNHKKACSPEKDEKMSKYCRYGHKIIINNKDKTDNKTKVPEFNKNKFDSIYLRFGDYIKSIIEEAIKKSATFIVNNKLDQREIGTVFNNIFFEILEDKPKIICYVNCYSNLDTINNRLSYGMVLENYTIINHKKSNH